MMLTAPSTVYLHVHVLLFKHTEFTYVAYTFSFILTKKGKEKEEKKGMWRKGKKKGAR